MIRYDPTFYLDESGDLGSNFIHSKTSRYFVVAMAFTLFPSQLNKLVGKTFKNLKKSDIKRNNGILHSNKEKVSTRRRMLKLIANSDTTLFVLKIDKNKLLVQNSLNKPELYNAFVNALTQKLLGDQNLSRGMNFRIIASRRETNKFLNEQFLRTMSQSLINSRGVNVETIIETPAKQKGLQVADFVAWSFFRKYEHNDNSYSSIIASRSIEYELSKDDLDIPHLRQR